MLAPPARHAATRRRQARWRARRRNGSAIFRLERPHDRVVEALLASGRVTDEASRRRELIERVQRPHGRSRRARNSRAGRIASVGSANDHMEVTMPTFICFLNWTDQVRRMQKTPTNDFKPPKT